MQTAKLFINGRSQAVRLPKDFRFEGDEVFIKRVGDAVVLLPRKEGWGTLEQALAAFEPGFVMERNQPEQQKRGNLAP
ncbi:MAG: antitoxin [Zoogloeaceae bacterium]|nr:antitoxin [Zoogloeaceae bacterium]MCK6383876.1 antitoxin [Rhodocyclaceae bacterium]